MGLHFRIGLTTIEMGMAPAASSPFLMRLSLQITSWVAAAGWVVAAGRVLG
jgi:hypothetical protein